RSLRSVRRLLAVRCLVGVGMLCPAWQICPRPLSGARLPKTLPNFARDQPTKHDSVVQSHACETVAA
ncbi:MAG: hypothetical protein ACKVHU_15640, partial [Acidimicrobiales bacterium]